MVPYMQRQKSMGGGKTRRTKKKGKEKSLRETKSYTKKKGKFGDLAKRKKRRAWQSREEKVGKSEPQELISMQSHKQNN